MTNTSIAVVVRRGVTRATTFLDPALRLEAKLLKPFQAQGKVGNLMLLVGPECGDRLFNSVLRDGGSPEKCTEAILRHDPEHTIACGPKHDVIGRSARASDPQAARAVGHRAWPLLLREGRRHPAAPLVGPSHVQINEPDRGNWQSCGTSSSGGGAM